MITTTPAKKILLPGDIPLEMIYVPGGPFLMGSEDQEAQDREKPVHEVELTSFWMGKYPVTQAQWMAITENNPSFFQGGSRPVEQVSWNDAQAFIEKLKQHSDLPFQLPTEAQWEFAARGGKSSTLTYAGSNKMAEVGWFTENSHRETKPVGLKAPNELGLYDMSGNVDEWCQDRYDSKYYEKMKQEGSATNPEGPQEGGFRVIRGGGWNNDARYCRVSLRGSWRPDDRFNNQGFRLALPQFSELK